VTTPIATSTSPMRESRLRMGSENTETARAVWTLTTKVK